jgi:hypothetical protein
VIALHRGDRHRRQELYSVTSGLGHEPFGQFGAGDAVGETRVVIDPVADPGLPA